MNEIAVLIEVYIMSPYASLVSLAINARKRCFLIGDENYVHDDITDDDEANAR